jgi:hypothetical protein
MLIMRIYKRSCLIYDYCTFLACKELTQKTLLNIDLLFLFYAITPTS